MTYFGFFNQCMLLLLNLSGTRIYFGKIYARCFTQKATKLSLISVHGHKLNRYQYHKIPVHIIVLLYYSVTLYMFLYNLYVYWALLLSEKIINTFGIRMHVTKLYKDCKSHIWPCLDFFHLKTRVQKALSVFLKIPFYWYKIASYPNMEPIRDIVGKAVCKLSRRLQKTPAENRSMILVSLRNSSADWLLLPLIALLPV